jgi:hypothetical protein
MSGRGTGRAMFAAILLLIAGTLNIIYGIAAISDANFFVAQTRYVFSNLNTWGWITLLLGILELAAGFSLLGGGAYGRIIGVAAATIGAIGALLSVGGAYPFWSLGVFALCIIVIHGLVVYEPPRDRAARGA